MNPTRIIRAAIASRKAHFKIGIPMRINHGFRESNIAHDMSFAFRTAGWKAFTEFPYGRGSIDAIFIRGSQVVICEWKRLYPRSVPKIAAQTKRLLKFDPKREFPAHRFARRNWTVTYLWVCDSWLERSVKDWGATEIRAKAEFRFDHSWKTGSHRFKPFGKPREWYPYFWLWAFRPR